MPDEPTTIPFLTDIGLLMTYKCQVTCPHCIVQASPRRTEAVGTDEVFEWIRQIAAYRKGSIKVLALTGGEPFYDLRLLRAVSDDAAGRGLMATAVSNAFWASSVDRAVSVLREVASISHVAFSTDVYHQLVIPLRNIENAVAATRLCGREHLILVCTQSKSDPGYLATMDGLREFTDDAHIRTEIAVPVGRAARELDRSHYETSPEPPVWACQSSSPIILPDGRVVACIGPVIDLETVHPLLLGDLRREPLADILDRAQTNPVLHLIRALGPYKLVALARAAGLGASLPEKYLSGTACEACYQLMTIPPVVSFLTKMAKDSEWQRKIAYARAYYLEEPEGMELLGLLPAAAQ